jgi:sugar/nucleoside kinase (ribokinase family)
VSLFGHLFIDADGADVRTDEIEFPAPRPPVRDILGGAGSYSALGARLFSPPPLSRSVGWIIDQGTDFPPAVTRTVASWTTSALIRPNPDRLTTRGWNGYLDAGSEHRSFKYMTPKRRLTASDLDSTLLSAKVFHIICSPARCRELVGEITARRKEEIVPDKYCKAVFIWEPVPDLCTPSELLNLTNALPLVDVCSPNHTELAGFMGDDGLDPATGQISTFAVERACEQLMGGMPLQSYTLVVRAGEKGCYVAKNGGRKRAVHPEGSNKKRRKPNGAQYHGGLKPDTDMEALFAGLLQDEEGSVAREEIEIDPGIEKWIPAVHVDGSRVVDPTGGGNCFLGGMGIALARGKGIEEACVWGSVAASFAIEQVGVPTLGRDEHGRETWNAVCVDDRLRDFENRLRA